ncbi:unnamed protein product [Polarella glacialis]|uniref:Uncharacterized protein n=1 Tax=Polarella glacialis TaxID=89957 RepID=A0A813HPM3_POLGL|nr:unnamed protein product [Polarella glacialis]
MFLRRVFSWAASAACPRRSEPLAASRVMTEEDAEAVYEFSRRGKLLDVRELLEQGVLPDKFMACDGGTALTMAARGGHGEVVELLLSHRADIDMRTDDGGSVLMAAVSGGAPRCIEALLQAKSNPNQRNDDDVSPLMLAGQYGHLEGARLLVNAKADVNDTSQDWGSALDSAVQAGHSKLAAYLTSLGAKQGSCTLPEGERKITAGEKWGYDAFDGEAPMLSLRSPALQKALPAEIPRLGLSVSATPPSAGARQRPASQDGAVSEAAPEPLGEAQDFFLFIKDYGWSLRYRVSKIAESVLNEEQPLELDWIKLRRPLRDPAELLDANKDQLFDWDTVAPAQHQGFMYHVTSAIGSGVEAVINFFEGHGLKLLIRPDTGIQLLGRGPRDAKTADDDQKPLEVTHCWVQVWGMPFLPMLQSIAFYNWHQADDLPGPNCRTSHAHL